jgi:hypothetical protein
MRLRELARRNQAAESLRGVGPGCDRECGDESDEREKACFHQSHLAANFNLYSTLYSLS